jgi:hypothetical protein
MFIFIIYQKLWKRELMSRIIGCDHSVESVYCFMILFLLYIFLLLVPCSHQVSALACDPVFHYGLHILQRAAQISLQFTYTSSLFKLLSPFIFCARLLQTATNGAHGRNPRWKEHIDCWVVVVECSMTSNRNQGLFISSAWSGTVVTLGRSSSGVHEWRSKNPKQ